MTDLIMILEGMQAWHWMAIGVTLLAIEVWTGTEILLGIGLGALAVGITHKLVPLGWGEQLIALALYSGMATFVYWKKFRAAKVENNYPQINKRAEQLIGRTAPLMSPLEAGRGKVQIGDALWEVTGPDLPEGAQVRVTGADGMTLVVEAME